MTMLAVKIPSPSIAKIEELVAGHDLDKDAVLARYMSIVNNCIEQACGANFVYEDTEITSSHIIANVKIGSLPIYKDMKTRYESINFEGELIKRINQARIFYKDGCPEPDGLLLNQSLTTWHHRWITAYIWTLICCSDQPEYFPVDKTVIELLFKRLEFAEIY